MIGSFIRPSVRRLFRSIIWFVLLFIREMSCRRQSHHWYFSNGRMLFLVLYLYVTHFSLIIFQSWFLRAQIISYLRVIQSFVQLTDRPTDWIRRTESAGMNAQDWMRRTECTGLGLQDWMRVFVGLLSSMVHALLLHTICMELMIPYYTFTYQILYQSVLGTTTSWICCSPLNVWFVIYSIDILGIGL